MPLRHKPNLNLISRWSLSQRGNSAKHFKPRAHASLFKQLNHTLATRRGGIKKSREKGLIFFPLRSSLAPKNLPSLRQHQSFRRSPRKTSTVHSSHCSSPVASLLDHYTWIPLSLHGLQANDTSEQNTMGTVEQYQACLPQEGRV